MRAKTIVYFRDKVAAVLPEAAIRAGLSVLQVSTEFQLQQLFREEDVDAVVISHDVPDRTSIGTNSGRICLLLEESASVRDLFWELTLLLSNSQSIQ